HDMWGTLHHAPERTLRAVLAAMGHTDTRASLKKLKELPWGRLIEPSLVALQSEQPPSIPIRFRLEEGGEAGVCLEVEFTEDGGRHEKRLIEGIAPSEETTLDGTRHVRVDIPNDTNRPLGYHLLKVRAMLPSGTLEGSMHIIVTPARCHRPEGRSWGITLSLYGLRSDKNAGAGDLGDLKELMAWAGGRLGAGFVGLNPLHDIPNSLAEGISPYSPISRLYRSLLYIDLAQVPYLDDMLLAEAGPSLKALRDTDLVDYDGVAKLKASLLKKAFGRFSEAKGNGSLPTQYMESYGSYLAQEGRALDLHALFMALAEHIRESGRAGRDWIGWPEQYRDPGGQAVEEFAKDHAPLVEFQRFLQWVLDCQMAKVAKAAEHMPIGLYMDLAVGSSDCGSDTWANQDLFALGINTGAPPDDFNPQGQNWIFPPMRPEGLRETGYSLFRKTLKANLAHAGALRIDHALGLFRIFFIPEGRPPSEGTYVDYPAEDLLRIIALESERAGAAIVAEDLGTITEEAREGLSSRDMLSYRILYFERDWERGAFLPPECYPEEALAAVNTHDLPTLRGFFEGTDIANRKELGIFDKDAHEKALEERERDKSSLINILERFLLQRGVVLSEMPDISLAAHDFLAATPSLLTSVSLDDITDSAVQQNMPGVTEGHPNWRRKCSRSLERLKEDSEDPGTFLASLIKAFRNSGRVANEGDV
ncbi:MAG: 4-alpha-glucanotransferase, partial [Thermodesulfovibrionales bacterium]|nr:4-alpha-glucanotransferase [Thermodesulfovibrionales bacterium]